MSDFDNLSEWRKSDLMAMATAWYWVKRSLIALTILIALIMGGCPVYSVWQQGLAGQAELKRAEQNRQIKIQEARATLESSELLAQAEAKRAEGVASANEIIGRGLKGNEEYLRYLWITGLEQCNGVVYIPTEAGIPILEAGRRPGPVARERAD